MTAPEPSASPRHFAAVPTPSAAVRALPKGRHLHCPKRSHMAMYNDQAVYAAGLISFLREVGRGGEPTRGHRLPDPRQYRELLG